MAKIINDNNEKITLFLDEYLKVKVSKSGKALNVYTKDAKYLGYLSYDYHHTSYSGESVIVSGYPEIIRLIKALKKGDVFIAKAHKEKDNNAKEFDISEADIILTKLTTVSKMKKLEEEFLSQNYSKSLYYCRVLFYTGDFFKAQTVLNEIPIKIKDRYPLETSKLYYILRDLDSYNFWLKEAIKKPNNRAFEVYANECIESKRFTEGIEYYSKLKNQDDAYYSFGKDTKIKETRLIQKKYYTSLLSKKSLPTNEVELVEYFKWLIVKGESEEVINEVFEKIINSSQVEVIFSGDHPLTKLVEIVDKLPAHMFKGLKSILEQLSIKRVESNNEVRIKRYNPDVLISLGVMMLIDKDEPDKSGEYLIRNAFKCFDSYNLAYEYLDVLDSILLENKNHQHLLKMLRKYVDTSYDKATQMDLRYQIEEEEYSEYDSYDYLDDAEF